MGRARFYRRDFVRMGVGAAAGVALVGCKGKPTPEAGEGGGATSYGKDTIVLRWHGRMGSQGDHFDRFIKKFNDDHFPGIYVKSEHFPGADYFKKVNTMIAGGTIGDGMWISAIEGFFRMAATGAFAPLDDIVAEMKYDLSQHEDNAEMGRYNGKLYTLPWNTQPGRSGLYFNKKMFDDAKVPYPNDNWTYDDLLDAAKEIARPQDGIWGMGVLTDYFGGIIHARAWGGDFLSKEGDKCLVKEPNAMAALEFVGDLAHKHKVSPLPDQVEVGWQQMFTANKLAMYQDGFWGKWVKQLMDPNLIGYARMPKGPGGVHGSMYEFCAVAVTSASKHPKETFELTTYFCSKEAGDDLAFVANSVPGGRPDVYDDPKNLEDPHFKVFRDCMREILPMYLPWNFRETEYAKVVTEALSLYFLGEKGLQEAAEQAYTDGQAVLQKESLAGDGTRFVPFTPIWLKNKS